MWDKIKGSLYAVVKNESASPSTVQFDYEGEYGDGVTASCLPQQMADKFEELTFDANVSEIRIEFKVTR